MRKKRKNIPVQEPPPRLRKKRKTVTSKIDVGKLISEYLMHSYLYYEKNEQVISDHEFDSIVDELLKNLDKIKASNHPHKHLMKKTMLASYTGFHLVGIFPTIVKICALELLYKNKSTLEILREV